jgi:hypothetical protein
VKEVFSTAFTSCTNNLIIVYLHYDLAKVNLFDVLLTMHHGTSMNQQQLDTLSLVCSIKSMPLHVSGITCPSSGGSAQMLFGVIAYVGCVLTAHAITPNSICAELPDDGRVMPKTSRGIDS